VEENNGDVRPFIKAKSHFADAKFFEEGSEPKEMMISTICSTGKGDSKVTKDAQVATGHNGKTATKGQRER